MTTYRVEIPGWRPASLNRLLKGHWGKAARRKARDRKVVAMALLAHGVRPATTPRRVGLVLRETHGAWPDPDNVWKSLLDALVRNGALVDDSAKWCELTQPVFERGARSTVIVLEDLQ